MSEPTVAADYDDRGARAAHAVLVELGQVLGAHRDAIVIIGGTVRFDKSMHFSKHSGS